MSYKRIDTVPLNDSGYKLRTLAAAVQRKPVGTQNVNGDEALYKTDNYAGSFTKSMAHDATDGYISDSQQFKNLTIALDSGKQADFDEVTLAAGAQYKLVDPQASLYTPMEGVDLSCIVSNTPPAVASDALAAEMVELYCKELTRDAPFVDWGSDSDITTVLDNSHINKANVLANINAPLDGGVVTLETLFRGQLPAAKEGPYISQLLYYDIPYGGMSLRQKYLAPKARSVMNPTTGDPSEFGVKKSAMINIQDGKEDDYFNISAGRFESNDRFIYSGRVLGEMVHGDKLFQHYYNAVQILAGVGCPLDAGLPAPSNDDKFTSIGGEVDIYHHVANVSGLVLKHAWFHKWQVHRRLRPEATSILLQNQKDSVPGYTYLSSVLTDNQIIEDIKTMHNDNYSVANSYLLSSVFPEGSPCHPAYPAGHATVAGACATVIKAFFDGTTKWVDLPKVASGDVRANNEAKSASYLVAQANSDGTDLINYTGSTANMTVNSEVNKLASNISLGRNWANVHYRSDGDWGMLIGEEVAINYLKEVLSSYNQTHNGNTVSLTLEKFDGTTITIEPCVV